MLGIDYLEQSNMDIKNILKKSIIVFFVGELVFLLISLYFNDFSFMTGFLLGYLVSIITFFMTVKMTDTIISLKQGSPILVGMFFVLKLVLIAVAFYLSIIFSQFFHLAGTFIGCLIMKVTLQIYYRKEVS